MKRNLILLSLLLCAVSASAAGSSDFLSRLFGNSAKTAQSQTPKVNQQKSDAIFESVRQQYAQGKISADSVVSLGVYHKVWSPQLAERCLLLVPAQGNLRNMTELGALYVFSPELAKHSAEGLKLLQTAAKAGYSDANAYLGLYYFNKNDFTKAKKYFDACRPMKYGFGFAGLGNIYFNGKGVTADRVKAREYYRQAALNGYARGMSLYGLNLFTGEGGAVDYPESFYWLYMAGDLGDDSARTTLFLPRRNENLGDTETAKTAGLTLQVIEALHNKQNIKDEPIYKEGFLASLKAREKAAEQGDEWARFYLGSMNYNGEFLNQNYAQALRYYEPIALSAKLPRAVLAVVNERLATMYREGKGTKADAAKAARYARAAAQKGSLPAYKIVEQIPK